jgi:chemotaxis protein MotA
MDLPSILGLVIGIGCIVGGQLLEGGHPMSLMEVSAAIIVVGGTVGAVMVSFPGKDLKRGLGLAKLAFNSKKQNLGALTKQIVEMASLARRDGVLALEGKLGEMQDPFLKRALQFVVDGVDADVARGALEASIDAEYQDAAVGAKVFESAGGYAPTIGILGAVLGLIHTMENLSDPSKIGAGIATAFVATVYGVGTANLLYLPMATKIKRKLAIEKERKTLIAEGVLAIQEGLNPRVLEEKLRSLAGETEGASESTAKAA